ncbi:hypothetical protein CV102_20905 [Natronococcus pandeyae]|uniref:Uncharacterized protein n=1 Tax=Natronococcus pandeyae TaxID=2055836 RepID=A0A8J8Q1L1_9EURY|nr:hypothetical protein [Natronococcus pandeyae]TYL36738.1 hypothetical protein CV102_20905 [Natronococcus pandeyae]
MARDDAKLDANATNSKSELPNQVTVVGHGTPASFELTVDGEIESAETQQMALVSNHAVEGAIETGVTRFRFSGEMANVHIGDLNGFERDDSPSSPTIHVEYAKQ